MPTNSQFWNQASIEPKRQFRWLLYLSGMPQFIVTDVKKPGFNIGSQTHTFLNYEFYYPGKVTWTDVSFSIVDPVQPDSAASLVKILEAAGYVVPDQYTSQSGFPKTISKKAMVDSLGGQIKLVQFGANTGDQTESVLEEWTINNPQLTGVDFGQLTYGSDELVKIGITLKYDWAFLSIPERTDARTWSINTPTTT